MDHRSYIAKQELWLALDHHQAGRLAEAERMYRQVLKFEPQRSDVLNNLGNVLKGLGRFVEAEQSYRQALAFKPDLAAAFNNLGSVLGIAGHLEAAERSFRDCLALDPENFNAHSRLIGALDLREPGNAREQQEERRRWYEQHGRRHAESVRPHENEPDPERRLRIGYVSADFRQHSALYIFAPIIHLRDRSAFEAVCYSGVKIEDDFTAGLRQAADDWRSTFDMPDDALAEQIRHDRIDILVDLSGHSAGNRLLVFARKPAPVQVTAWGYATGTGLKTMDYFLADPVLVPQEERVLYAEEMLDLPCFVCYAPPEYLPAVSGLPAFAGKPFTFGCINRVQKISNRAIGFWSWILAAVPQSRLLIKDKFLDDPMLQERFLGRLIGAGIRREQIRLVGSSDHLEHLKIYHEVDLCLDPYPHGGGVSTLEALWMGIPVVTLRGPTAVSRLSASILTALHLEDGIAGSEEQYVQKAVHAARDLLRLGQLRQSLRPYVQESVVGDLPRYIRAVEAAYRSIWRRWCAQARRVETGAGR